ncbi:MAG: DUF4153 domain-containing protein [Pseudomonadota bacterium]
MSEKTQSPAKLLILISLIQGFILLFLHQAIELKFWPNSSPQWLFSFYSMAFVGPIMLLLGLKTNQEVAVVKWALPFTIIAGLLGYYVGYQSTPIAHVKYDALLFAFITTMGIAVFKALIYVQQFVSGEKFSYSHLFRWSWRNFLTLVLALLFAACFWGVLMLWAGLFKAIKINFFYDLFTECWFYYPAVALANGFGVIIFRNLSQVIDTITRLQQALMKFLLVILVLVSILFLCTLPLTGLAPLWESGGSGLILWMQAIILFFINAVYQDDPDMRPYHLWLHRFIYCGAALLPIYSAISFYGLSLRVDQYGWSIERCWAMLTWLLLALFSIGYWVGIIRYRDNWLRQLSKVNVSMGLVVLAVMLLVNSPVLDFRKIVVNSQLQRLENKKILIDDFDINYFREHLARPGYLALEDLKAKYAKSNLELVVRINSLYSDKKNNAIGSSKQEFIAAVKISSGVIPDDLATAIYINISSKNKWELESIKRYYLMPLDMNSDGQLEYLFVKEMTNDTSIDLYFLENAKWLTAGFSNSEKNQDFKSIFFDAVAAGKFEIAKPAWQDLMIGGYRLHAD